MGPSNNGNASYIPIYDLCRETGEGLLTKYAFVSHPYLYPSRLWLFMLGRDRMAVEKRSETNDEEKRKKGEKRGKKGRDNDDDNNNNNNKRADRGGLERARTQRTRKLGACPSFPTKGGTTELSADQCAVVGGAGRPPACAVLSWTAMSREPVP